MKEDKFILIGMVCLIVFCRFWDVFVIEPAEISAFDEAAVVVQTPQNQNVAEKIEEKPVKNFIGCGSGFSSQSSANFINGNGSAVYSAQSTIWCDCKIDGQIVKKTVVYQYSSKPTWYESDCNFKCGEICTEK